MTKYTPLYEQAGTYNAKADRTPLTNLYAEGILGSGSFLVTQRAAGANFTVDIAAGVAVVTGDVNADQGRYWCRETAATTGTTVTSAPSAGNERYDLVVLEVRDNTEDSSTFNDWRFRVVAGTPASVGTAVAPAVPSSCLLLATIGPILNSTTTITNSLIVDGRVQARLVHEVVTTASIVDANVTTAKIADSAVTSAKIADATIVGGDVANDTLTDTQMSTANKLSGAWTAVSLVNGWTTAASRNALQYKKIGNLVFLCGSADGDSKSSSTLGTMPVGFRPSAWAQAVCVAGTPLSGNGLLTVESNGTISASVGAELITVNLVYPV